MGGYFHACLPQILSGDIDSTDIERARLLITILAANLRRIVFSNVHPREAGLLEPLADVSPSKTSPEDQTCLQYVHSTLLLLAGEPGGAMPEQVPLDIANEVADTLSTGLSLFYPTQQACNDLRRQLAASGGVLEVQMEWARSSHLSTAVAAASAENGDATQAVDLSQDDIRIERAVLLLQLWAQRQGWEVQLHGAFGHSVVLCIALPKPQGDTDPVFEALDAGLRSTFAMVCPLLCCCNSSG